ncbi:MAG: hypothetical protein H7125_11135 [Proteobacteria bacterium]|nr:hypothetical protein [Burkholderiales bacterium]
MDTKRLIALLLSVSLLAGAGLAIYYSASDKRTADRTALTAAQAVSVRGLIGSEKEAFFTDAQVVAALARHGVTVTFEKVGSRQQALREDLKNYDFAFPAGVPAALKIQQISGVRQSYTTFFTAMAIASWRSLLPVLEANGLVERVGDYHTFDMAAYLALVEKGVRWRDLKNNSAFQIARSVTISSTDARTSNSAAMYLALASYSANGMNILQNTQQADKVAPLMAELFLRQGLQERSSSGPFEDYVALGIGKTPLVMIYESQFLEFMAARKTRNPEMVLLYPKPTVFTKHVLIPFTPAGQRLGELLANDPDLQRLAARQGYRTANPDLFAAYLKDAALDAPLNLIDVVDPPTFELLERLIEALDQRMK